MEGLTKLSEAACGGRGMKECHITGLLLNFVVFFVYNSITRATLNAALELALFNVVSKDGLFCT